MFYKHHSSCSYMDCGYTLEPGSSNEYSQSLVCAISKWGLREHIYHMGMLAWCYLSCVVRKLVLGISDQVQHKPGCTATGNG